MKTLISQTTKFMENERVGFYNMLYVVVYHMYTFITTILCLMFVVIPIPLCMSAPVNVMLLAFASRSEYPDLDLHSGFAVCMYMPG